MTYDNIKSDKKANFIFSPGDTFFEKPGDTFFEKPEFLFCKGYDLALIKLCKSEMFKYQF